jgi:16S rRNA (cytidine1402-2'-O)-methyltransferase
MSKLYVVATPIGNLEDITLRALRILKEVDVIVCEDTRVTKKLLAKYNIETTLESLNARTEERKVQKIVELLIGGKDIALVSDAGTPTISDPGTRLVVAARRAGGVVEVIPGPNAAIAALSVSGLPSSSFVFLGFLPHKKGREKLFKEIVKSNRTVVFYESPHRLLKTLESLNSHLGEERQVVVAHELTKVYEGVWISSAGELHAYFLAHPDEVRGEFVILVEPFRSSGYTLPHE